MAWSVWDWSRCCPVPRLRRAGPRRLRHDGRRRRLELIGNESVQKELKLDDTQVTKAKELADKNREKMTAAREETKDLDQEERTNEDGRAQQRDQRVDPQGRRLSSSSPSRSPVSSRFPTRLVA